MEQGPSGEENSSLASEDIPQTLWYLKVHHHVHEKPPLSAVVSQITQAQTLPSYLFNIHFNITVSHMPVPSKSPISFTYHH
jgi:hypothetical protein